MSQKTVFCQKLQLELPGLAFQPYPGELGERIHANISEKAWSLWMQQQTILINEHRLNVLDPSARSFLEEKMEAFFFGGGIEMPEGYTPPSE